MMIPVAFALHRHRPMGGGVGFIWVGMAILTNYRGDQYGMVWSFTERYGVRSKLI